MTYQLTSLGIGLLIATAILWLVRRDHLHGPYAIWWIGVALSVAILGLWPRLFDGVASVLGVSYPPILAVVLGFGLLLVKMLTMDIERSRQERKIRRLAQRLALLEADQRGLGDADIDRASDADGNDDDGDLIGTVTGDE
ncbi:DUF2304 domain-containing protein [Rhabdochromatium marinum]|uniref:DUF2304 domain-containing protein n=1 Tax=Rhabdochromatium marinum TaxID=48729 RepID=UPI00190496D1|nr:DUF2304 domain-containing protein [Rhabdochromatium marinum]MBK1647754.1 hypothetical protein [Rhabdochromatium marinum]